MSRRMSQLRGTRASLKRPRAGAAIPAHGLDHQLCDGGRRPDARPLAQFDRDPIWAALDTAR